MKSIVGQNSKLKSCLRRYFIPPRNVIPVPDGHESQNLPEVPAGQDVLALYPGTTCFYKATVILPPNKVRNKVPLDICRKAKSSAVFIRIRI